MNTPYTDVDKMILGRWDEVVALQEAYEELLERMAATIESACRRTGPWIEEQGFDWEFDQKQPLIWAWKSSWEKPKGDPMITLEISEFAPFAYGKVTQPHPHLALSIEGLERIKLKDQDRVRFSRDLKSALGRAAAKWDHADCEEASDPLGRKVADVGDRQRVEMVRHPAGLVTFFEAGFRELFELAPAIDDTLKKHRGSGR